MANITQEIRNCLRLTGKTQTALARASGVSISSINFLLTGRRKDVYGKNQDALRRGINILLMEHQKLQGVNADNNLTAQEQKRNN